MPTIIDKIRLFSFETTQLFFAENRVGEEVRLNLASFPPPGPLEPDAPVSGALQEVICKMEVQIGRFLANRRAIFYMWHDEQVKLLRWTIISDVGQAKLPFSSNITEVDMGTVVEEWTRVTDNPGLLTMSEIEKMTSADLRKISRAQGIPTINVFVRRIAG